MIDQLFAVLKRIPGARVDRRHPLNLRERILVVLPLESEWTQNCLDPQLSNRKEKRSASMNWRTEGNCFTVARCYRCWWNISTLNEKFNEQIVESRRLTRIQTCSIIDDGDSICSSWQFRSDFGRTRNEFTHRTVDNRAENERLSIDDQP